MNMKKIIAGAVASVLAVSTMAVAASAGTIKGTLGIPGIVQAGDNWSLDLAGEGVLDGISINDVYGATIVFSKEDVDASAETGIGGAFVFNGTDSAGKNWNAVEWGNADAGKPITLDVDTCSITRLESTPYFDDADITDDTNTWAQIALQTWWGPDPVTVVSLSLLGKDGNVLKTFGETPAAATPEPGATDGAGADPNKGSPDTGVEGVAVVAGLAIIAAGAVVVAKKRG